MRERASVCWRPVVQVWPGLFRAAMESVVEAITRLGKGDAMPSEESDGS